MIIARMVRRCFSALTFAISASVVQAQTGPIWQFANGGHDCDSRAPTAVSPSCHKSHSEQGVVVVKGTQTGQQLAYGGTSGDINDTSDDVDEQWPQGGVL
jgi:hypothetical protein